MSRAGLQSSTPPVEEPGSRLPGVELVRRRGWWVLLGGVVGLVAGSAVTLVQEPTYESSAYVTVAAVGDTDPTSLARAAQALARLGAAPSVVAPPLEAAGLPEAAANPQLFVRVQAAPDASIISVTASAGTPTAARDIAATVSETLVELPAFATFSSSYIAEPELPAGPTTPEWLAPVGLAATGGALGVVLAATVVPGRRARVGGAETAADDGR